MRIIFRISLLILLTLGFVPAGFADRGLPETISIELQFTPNLENGARLYKVCESCHLPDGWGNDDGVYPQLAGQHPSVLMQQLLDIRDGKRDNPAMYPFVQQRTIGGYQNLADVVAYISTLPMSPDHGRGKWDTTTQNFAEGKELYAKKCASCHGEQALGNDATKTPRLQGQHYNYLLQQVKLIATLQRKAHPSMMAVIETLNQEDIVKILNFISYIPSPQIERAEPAE